MYKCRTCGYKGDELIFQFVDNSYCVASNAEEPEYKGDIPKWVKDKGVGEAEIGDPVGCPKCRAWGVHNFENIIVSEQNVQ
ncbi:MAG TPA: hypothetical protein ACFYD3_00875 [Candidatus Hypogeohydataceae bacterium YC41]